jgi:hypothetical protein
MWYSITLLSVPVLAYVPDNYKFNCLNYTFMPRGLTKVGRNEFALNTTVQMNRVL